MGGNGKALIDRLTSCGYTESDAVDMCLQYASCNRLEELEDYIRANELFFNDWKQYPSER